MSSNICENKSSYAFPKAMICFKESNNTAFFETQYVSCRRRASFAMAFDNDDDDNDNNDDDNNDDHAL
jgi:hypothetical protein